MSVTNFPKQFALVDTGERRYPEYQEFYCWQDPSKNIVGPEQLDDPEDEIRWIGGPENFAIYRFSEEYDQ